MTKFRVENRGRINRDRPVTFTFDGETYDGYEGDTVASALLANGVHLMGRGFKYHRPRGVLTAGSEEPNALIGTSRGPGRFEPNTRATVQEIHSGLNAESQNRWPSLKFDVGAINDRLYMLFSAGFYYKTFMWPKSFWDRVYEPFIRRAAGLGRAPTEIDPDRYASRHLHCDVLIVGAGPAGLAAALTAGRTGADVVLVDENSEAGGTLLSEPSVQIDGASAWDWLAATLAELDALPNVRILTRTTAIGYYHQNMVGLCQKLTDHLTSPPDDAPRERLWRVRAGQVILAQGAIERPLVFDGNDRPGVMLAGAAQTYLNRYGVKVGDRPAILTSHDSAWYAAFDLADAGVNVAAIIDTRSHIDDALTEGARSRNIELLTGHTATATSGRLRVESVRVNPMRSGKPGPARKILCDALLMSGGWTPSLHLFSHTKGTLHWDAEAEVYLPGERAEACHIAGAGRGLWGIARALEDGAKAGSDAVRDLDRSAEPVKFAVTADRTGKGVFHKELPTDRSPGKAKAFIDFQNDVTAKDIRLAVREGMRSIEHVKRYTTNGMATDQGKMSNMNGLTIAADALGKAAPQVGLTTFRPPYTPTTFGAFAGYHKDGHFEVTRKTPIDPWAAENGAVFEPVALWRRAWYFPKPGEDMHAAVNRECRATRASLGHLRRLHARQDRSLRPRRGRVHEPHVHQPLDQARARPLPLRPAARRGRFHPRRRRDRPPARRSLPRHHHDRRRRPRPQHDGGLPPDRMAGSPRLAHLHNRAMGDDRPQRPQRPQAAGAARRGPGPVRRRVPAHVRRRMHGRGLPVAPLPHQLHRRTRLRGQRPRPPRPRALGDADGSREAIRHLPLRHRDDARPARRKGLHHHRSGHRRHRHARRCRPRLGHRQGKARFRRQTLARPPRHRGARAAASSSAC